MSTKSYTEVEPLLVGEILFGSWPYIPTWTVLFMFVSDYQ